MECVEIVHDEAGMILTRDNIKNNKSKFEFYNFLKNNNYEQITRGIYAAKDAWIDPLLIANKRCPNAVMSHDTALHYYGLVDREPDVPTFTIYSGYNASRLKSTGYKVFFVKKEYLEIGKIEVTDFDGNIIPMYDLERTVCDLVRNRNSFEIQDFNTALKTYVRKKDKNLNKLFEYAKLFRIEKLMRFIVEVLL